MIQRLGERPWWGHRGHLRGASFALWLATSLAPAPAIAWVQQSDLGYRAVSLALDGGGDVIAGAESYFSIRKFAGDNGAEMWLQTIYDTGFTDHDSVGARVAVDGAGNVVAAGNIDDGFYSTKRDFTVAKFAGATGNELWRQVINGTRNEDDTALAVTVDGAGDVIAVGALDNAGTGSDFAVLKFAGGTGTELWRQEIDGGPPDPYPYLDYALAVTVDGAGDVVVAGILGSGYAVIKFAGGTGAELWRQSAGPGPVAVDSASDVIVNGGGIAKLAGSTGMELWRQQGVGAAALALDAAGDVIAAGGSNVAQMGVTKLAGDTGLELWHRDIDGSAVTVNFSVGLTGVAVNGSGDVVATGVSGNQFSGTDFTVLKLAGSTGADLWRQDLTRLTGANEGGSAVTVDAAGDVIAGGSLGTYLTVAKLSGVDGAVGPVRGTKLKVSDRAGDPSARMISVLAKDPLIVTDPPGSTGDPTLGGATLRLVNPVTLESATISLPAGALWTALGSPPGSAGYRYRTSVGGNGACASLEARPGKLQARCLGTLGTIPFSLDEPSQGALTVSVQLGSAAPQCATFGGTIRRDAGTGNPGPTGVFSAQNAPAATGDCP